MSINIQDWSRRTKILTQALIVSGALNIGLLATFFYFVMQGDKEAVAFELKPPKEEVLIPALTNELLLSTYSTLSFPELLDLLGDQEVVEAGYKKRDLALACLTTFHYFNLEKALGTSTIQRRQLSFIHNEGQEKIDVDVFPGLTEEQYGAVLQYSKTEKWPMTSEGLFFELQHSKLPRDPSLLETFYLTNEFHAIATLFSRSGLSLKKEILVDLICHGDWKIVQEFTQEQKQAQDLSPARIRTFLMKFLKKRALLAARILLEVDREFVVNRLDDSDLMLLLDLFTEKSPALELLVKEILQSPRTDAVLKKAAEKLYAFAGTSMPEPYNHSQTLQMFFPQQAQTPQASEIPRETSKNGKRLYIVQQGDSLWKIAKKHRVTIDALMKKNRLESEKLKVGKELEIPLD